MLPQMLPSGDSYRIFFGGRAGWLSVCLKSLKLLGSPGRIRTSDQPVNSRLLYH
jgi:hypothetical protein